MFENGETQAAIGIGSNSVRLLIGRRADPSLVVLERGEIVTRLAQYRVAPNGENMLDPRMMSATLDAALRFKARIDALGVPLKGVLAGEAVRAASNGAELVEDLQRSSGMSVTILTGDEEAELGWGALGLDLQEESGILGVIDIGGGSVELSVGVAASRKPEATLSIPLGARELTRRYSLHKPVEATKSLGNLASLSIEINSQAAEMQPRPDRCTVIGGTSDVLLGAFSKLEGQELPEGTAVNRNWLASVFMRVAALPVERRSELGVPADLADIAPAGAAILLVLLDAWGLPVFSLSNRNILDGYLARE